MNIKYVLDGDDVWYKAADIGRILKLKGIRSSPTGRPVSERRTMRMPTNGGDQKTTFLNLNGVKRLVCNSRSMDASVFAKKFGIEILSNRFVPKETETLSFLRKIFVGIDMKPQYRCGEYLVDLYIPSCKLAVECDEDGTHGPNRAMVDFQREQWIRSELGCSFVRYRPDEHGFDMADVASKVFQKIVEQKP
ncbi:unnamed protein product [Ectocarpus sp. 8 AP-2014]